MLKDEISDLLNQNGFEIELWQDQSGYLKDIAIKINYGGGSLLDFQKALASNLKMTSTPDLHQNPVIICLFQKTLNRIGVLIWIKT
jgi:FixJ family two-component response regulator